MREARLRDTDLTVLRPLRQVIFAYVFGCSVLMYSVISGSWQLELDITPPFEPSHKCAIFYFSSHFWLAADRWGSGGCLCIA